MAVTTVVPLTLEEFSQLPGNGERHEMSAGELITTAPPKSLHSLICLAVLEVLQAYLRQQGFGRAIPEAGYVLSRNPLTIRQPDVSVLSKERIYSTGTDEYFEGAPELAIEVVSPWDSAEDLEIKVNQHLAAGSKQVWVLYPKSKCVLVSYPGGTGTMLRETQTLTGGDLLPQFSVKVGDLFLTTVMSNYEVGTMPVIVPAPLTIDEFSRLPRDGERHEMSAGELITMAPPKSLHSRIATNLFKLLVAALDKSRTSEAFIEAGYVLGRNPLTIRQPGVSVLSKERVQATAADDYFESAPELAVEVVSPSDSSGDLQIKIDQYLLAGSKQVWVFYPQNKRVQVFYPDKTAAMLDETQTLSGGDVLPGFSVQVSDLFL